MWGWDEEIKKGGRNGIKEVVWLSAPLVVSILKMCFFC